MRHSLILTLTLAFTSMSFLSYGQSGDGITFGAYYNYRVYANDILGGYHGVGVKGGYALEQMILGAEVGYGSFSETTRMTTANAFSSGTEPSYIDVESTLNTTAFELKGYGKYFFSGGSEDGGFFGTVKVNLAFFTLDESYDATENERNNYDIPEDGEENMTQPYIDLGVGYELELGPGKAYAEVIAGLPANEVNGQQIDVSAPLYFGPMLGYRF